ncbi:hypothetical protein yc1106_01601 [Curvularia clavata]|uniref:Uncharacterized protein n=1 Tax=Curvularia clavata TaxID=95742 RepID=A0A9Q8Z237_CURCL|nr:hypothetical protein yc1106_01601 [Curvularia clavata]
MTRKAEHNHELNELPSSARLLDVERPKLKCAPPLKETNSKIRVFLKHLGLQLPDTLVGAAFAWRSPEEHRKVAIYQNRSMAALNSLLHLVPISACIVLLVLFWSKKWTGGPSDNATTLQFVAKLHELLMQSSLIAILLHIIRSQAINGFIPLGALSGATKGPQLSYLWSLDFFSAIMSSKFGKRSKVSFALSTLGLLVLTGVVGPSSAVLMIPRPGMPYDQIKETIYMNVSELETFPSSFNYTHNLNFSTFDQRYDTRPLEFYKDSVGTKFATGLWGDVYRSRTMKISTVMSPELKPLQSIVTIPTVLSMTQLSNRMDILHQVLPASTTDEFANITLIITTSQPVTLVTCSLVPSIEDEDVYYLLHNRTSRFLSTAADMYERMRRSNESFTGNGEWLPPLWMPSPEDPASLIIVILLNRKSDGKSFVTCTVTPFWWRAKTWRSAWSNQIIYTDLPAMEHVSKQFGFRPITIATEGIAAINSVRWLEEIGELTAPFITPDIVATMFVSAISQFPGRSPDDKEDIDEKYLSGIEASEIVPESHTQFEYTATSYGYGYGATDTSIRLSVAVIIAYCIIAILYVIYIIATGHTSIAWDSATELIMLALQSKEPKDLGYVSVGLCSTETFRRGVGIRVSTVKDDETGELREKLELVFDNVETEKRGLTKVVRGNAY